MFDFLGSFEGNTSFSLYQIRAGFNSTSSDLKSFVQAINEDFLKNSIAQHQEELIERSEEQLKNVNLLSQMFEDKIEEINKSLDKNL